MEKVLSIVIPSYNTEKFMDNILSKLAACKELNYLDVLVVDDGSTDQTAEQARKYAIEYPYSIQVISKENGGHGSTINCGINAARGKYFKVVDADDWLDTNNLDEFVRVLKKKNTDLIFNPFWTFNDKNSDVKLIDSKPNKFIFDHRYSMDADVSFELPSIHSYTIKTSILKDNGILIDEHAFYVDVEYILYPLPYVKHFEFVNIPVYFYRINQGRQSISVDNMKKNKLQHEHVLKQVNLYMNKINNENVTVPKALMMNRISKMVAAQFKIIALCGIGLKTRYNLLTFNKWVKNNVNLDMNAVNLPIRTLIKTNFWLLPIIHYLAIAKMKIIHV